MSRRTILALAKAAISVALIWFLASRVDISDLRDRLGGASPAGVLLAMLLMAGQTVIAAERWRRVSRAMDIAIPFGRAFRIVLIGLFFNQTLPSSIGGDAVRVWLTIRDAGRLGKAVNCVLGDRVLALVVLFGLMAATLPLFLSRIDDAHMKIGIVAVSAAGLGGFAVLMVFGSMIVRLLQRWNVTKPFAELAADFRGLFLSPARAALLIGSSLLIHLMTIAMLYVMAAALNIDAPLVDFVIVVPAVILVTTLPISVAGWGVREGAMIVGLGQVGVGSAEALAISLCFGLLQLAAGLPGGVLWLFERSRPEKQPPAP